ncbi:MAG: hypothetical protein MK089_12175, partial [Phycisphaerales bacterium]|nr:hypothetical protein [Phycisphaerales bacterium]
MGHDAEQSISADRQREELRILCPTARERVTGMVDDLEGLDVTDERRELQAPTMDVRRERAPDGHPVDARLFLPDSPGDPLAILVLMEVLDQLRPH